jgi:hypothetical protein
MNTGLKGQRPTTSRTSVASPERTSTLPASAPSRSSSLSERPRESGEVFIDRTPRSSRQAISSERYLWSSARLLETPYCSLRLDHRHGIVRFTRSDQPYPSLAALEHEVGEIDRLLERMSGARVLVDLRAASPRNDPGFELVIKQFRRKLFERSERTAVLVRTAVGALQVKRHMREDGFSVEVFQSEEEAVAHLDGPSPESSRRVTALPPPPTIRLPYRGS